MSVKQQKEGKRHPATKGYAVAHPCGHEGRHRTHLLWYAKSPRTPESDAGVAKLVSEAQEMQKVLPCPNCLAEADHMQSRVDLTEMFHAMGLETPQELKGTIRQKAWGESVRKTAVFNVIRQVVSIASQPKLGTILFYELTQTDHDLHDDVKTLTVRLRKLLEESAEMAYPYYQNTVSETSLAVAGVSLNHLFSRASSGVLFNEARAWMLRGKSAYAHSVTAQVVETNIIMHSIVALSLRPGCSLSSTLEVLKACDEHVSATDVASVQQLRKQTSSVEELFEVYQVEKSLRPPDPLLDVPF